MQAVWVSLPGSVQHSREPRRWTDPLCCSLSAHSTLRKALDPQSLTHVAGRQLAACFMNIQNPRGTTKPHWAVDIGDAPVSFS